MLLTFTSLTEQRKASGYRVQKNSKESYFVFCFSNLKENSTNSKPTDQIIESKIKFNNCKQIGFT